MDTWINLHALWRIAVVGLICGAGLPAVFAIGVRATATPARGSDGGRQSESSLYGGSPAGAALGALCFLVVLAAIAWGIYLIVKGA